VQGKAQKEIHAILTQTLGEHAPSYATVKNWVTQFKHGEISNCDAPRPGRPKTVTTLEIIDQIHELILEDRWISAKSITEHLGISRERIWSIIREDQDIRKISEALREMGPEMPERDFFGIKTASSSLIIFQRAKLSTPNITHLYWCN